MASVAQPELGPTGDAGSPARRSSRAESLFNLGVFALFVVLWLVFAVALIWDQGGLDQTWAWIQSLPLILQAVLWLLFLPVMAGLWVWETTWPLVIRVALIVGLAAANLYLFFPRALPAGRP